MVAEAVMDNKKQLDELHKNSGNSYGYQMFASFAKSAWPTISAQLDKLEATLAYKEKNMVAIEEECAEQLEAGAKLAEAAYDYFYELGKRGRLLDAIDIYQKIVEDN